MYRSAWVFNCDLGPQIGSDNLTNIFQMGRFNHQLDTYKTSILERKPFFTYPSNLQGVPHTDSNLRPGVNRILQAPWNKIYKFKRKTLGFQASHTHVQAANKSNEIMSMQQEIMCFSFNHKLFAHYLQGLASCHAVLPWKTSTKCFTIVI